jgi:hypothetical protein
MRGVRTHSSLESMSRLHLLPLLLGFAPTLLHGQIRADATRIVIAGTVRADSSASPPHRTMVCLRQPQNRTGSQLSRSCVSVTSSGHYSLEGTALGPYEVWAYCGTEAGANRFFFSTTIDSIPHFPSQVDISTSSYGCDPRPPRRYSGTYSGHWRTGFEASQITLCPAVLTVTGMPFLTGETFWVDIESSMASSKHLVFPPVTIPPRDAPTYFVRFRGSIAGPGDYGRYSAFRWQVTMDSILSLSDPAASRC